MTKSDETSGSTPKMDNTSEELEDNGPKLCVDSGDQKVCKQQRIQRHTLKT